MSETLKDEMSRAREEAKLTEEEMTRAVPKFRMPDEAIPGFTDEAPTRPGTASEAVQEKSGAIRRMDLPSVLLSETEDADARLTVDITPVLPPLPPPAAPAETVPAEEPRLTPIGEELVAPRALWPRVLVVAVALAALGAAAFELIRVRG